MEDVEEKKRKPLTCEQIEDRWRKTIGNPVFCPPLADPDDHREDEELVPDV